ncbi:MAG: glycosyltransferase [Acidobacteriota bacterium]
MNKIRVVHLITKLELGGAQRNTIFTCENLNRSKFEVFLMAGAGGILSPDPALMNNGGENGEERFIYIKDLVREINPLRDFKAYRSLVKEFSKIKPDIVHTHSSKAGIIGRIAAKKAGVPFTIHSVHGFSFSPYQHILKRTIFRKIEKFVSRFTDHFIFVSAGDISAAGELGLLKRSAYSLIRSGFDFEKFKNGNVDLEEIRKKYSINKSDFVCGVIAPFKPQKGLHNLIRIAENVLKRDRRVLFLIAGDGDLREELETELERSGIRDRFRLPGFIHEIGKVIPVFDIGVSTALWEGLPQSLVQLRLLKKAVIATDIPGNNEVIKDGLNGFTVKVNNIEGFADKILYLKEKGGVRNSFASYAEDLESWDGNVMVRSQEELYSSLVRRETI